MPMFSRMSCSAFLLASANDFPSAKYARTSGTFLLDNVLTLIFLYFFKSTIALLKTGYFCDPYTLIAPVESNFVGKSVVKPHAPARSRQFLVMQESSVSINTYGLFKVRFSNEKRPSSLSIVSTNVRPVAARDDESSS